MWANRTPRCSGISSPTICCVLSYHVIVWVVQRISCLFLPICNYHLLPKLATALPRGHLALQHRSLKGISAVSLVNKSDYSEHRRACPHPQEEDLEMASVREDTVQVFHSLPQSLRRDRGLIAFTKPGSGLFLGDQALGLTSG